MNRLVSLLLGALACFAVTQVAGEQVALAERKNVLDGQPAVRRRHEMRRMRFELTPQFAISLNQDFKQFLGGGALLQFHILDWLAVGTQVVGGGALDTDLTGKVNEQLVAGPTPFQPTKQQFNDHLAALNVLWSLHATLTPVSGKMMIFGALPLKYDMYALVGFGGMNVANGYTAAKYPGVDPRSCANVDNMTTNPNECDPQNAGFKFAGVFGVGVHLFFNDYIGLNFEVRDFINRLNQGGLDVNGDRKVLPDDEKITNNLFFGFGLTIMLPPKTKISN